MKTVNKIFLAFATLLACSCVHEFAVTDNSFEFSAAITYDSQADEHRLTLTRKGGAEDNQYKIAFTLDGEANVSLTDMNGTTHEGRSRTPSLMCPPRHMSCRRSLPESIP